MRRRAHDRITVHHKGLEVVRTPEDHEDATWTALPERAHDALERGTVTRVTFFNS
jgi:hypothetical protein